ncbi:probable reductases with broad range of substrate specificities [Phialocephala subalpina]|uniref:2,4-dienoyl-CoA reductase [(3E)-enoyl-CoA-producing] n=1 Tax=Phialocephala subalpina TaxID=576137 RepID=A0A1L7XLN5_9HELO|nr:probable reductases with broad range of substrate specificities [Phialocephala subalpina]
MPKSKNQYLSDAWSNGLFDRKVVFCTGGSGTICSAQVRAMVHLGADACIVGRNVENAEQVAKDIATCRKGAKVLGIGNIDVRKIESLNAAVERCVKELGGLDFVIAGAAGNFLAPITQLSTNAFKSVIDIDVLGSYNTLKATIPHLIKSADAHRTDGVNTPVGGTGGRIIFISATIQYTGVPLQTHLGAAKSAVDSLSGSIALEMGPRGVTSNVICPGAIAGTEGLSRLAKAESSGSKDGLETIPLGRLGTVKEIADATVFLFSDAGSYVNGDRVIVDGGAWRMGQGIAGPGSGFAYPKSVLSDAPISGVQGTKKSPTKL